MGSYERTFFFVFEWHLKMLEIVVQSLAFDYFYLFSKFQHVKQVFV